MIKSIVYIEQRWKRQIRKCP